MKKILVFSFFLIFLASCVPKKEKEVYVPRPKKEIGLKPIPEIPSFQLEKKRPKKEILYTLSAKGADVKTVLMSFAKKSNINMVIDPDVSGTVNIDLKDVTLDQALTSILRPLGYKYERKANFIIVEKPKLETRIFTLNYILTKRTGSATMSAAGGLSGGYGTTATTTTTTSGTTYGGYGGGGISSVESTIESKEEADIWSEIKDGLDSLLSKDGKFFVNKMASAIVVTDYPENLDKIARYLEIVEGTVQRQVLIEAKIIEVTLSNEHQMGIDWNYIMRGSARHTFTQAVESIPGFTLTGLFQYTFVSRNFNLVLKAMQSQGKVEVISSPRITTLNNQKAMIKVARQDIAFVTTETTTGTVGEKEKTTTPQVIPIGVILDVTPYISQDGYVIMNIHPVITEKVGEAVSPTGDRAPIVDIREASTIVKVKNNHTLILAGLLMRKKKKEESGIPVLKEVPFFGSIFGATREEKRKTELVVALTPRIMVGRSIEDMTKEELMKVFGKKIDESSPVYQILR